MNSIRPAHTAASPRVAQALGAHQSIAACHARIARDGGRGSAEARAAALMLPCYEAAFLRLACALTLDEARELRHALEAVTDRTHGAGPARTTTLVPG